MKYDDKYRVTSMAISLLIQRLYGQKSYSLIKSWQDVISAKKYYSKILKSLIFSVNETIIISDKNQLTELLRILEFGISQIKLCKTFDEIDQRMIATLGELSFQLMGMNFGMPENLWLYSNMLNGGIFLKYWIELSLHVRTVGMQ